MKLEDVDKLQKKAEEKLALYIQEEVEESDFTAQVNDLNSKESLQNKYRHELEEKFALNNSNVFNPIDFITTHIDETADPEQAKQIKEKIAQLKNILSDFLTTFENEKELLSFLEQMPILNDYFQFSEESIHVIYNLAAEYYNRSQYVEADAVLSFLLSLVPDKPVLWELKGLIQQNQQLHSDALASFNIARQFQQGSFFLICLYCAKSYGAQGATTEANEELSKAKEMLDENPELKKDWELFYDYFIKQIAL